MNDDWRFDLEQWPGPYSDPIAALKTAASTFAAGMVDLTEAIKKGLVHITLHTSDPMKER